MRFLLLIFVLLLGCELSASHRCQLNSKFAHEIICQADAAMRCKCPKLSGLLSAMNEIWQADRNFQNA